MRALFLVFLLSGCLAIDPADGPFTAAPLGVEAAARDANGLWEFGAPVERLAVDGQTHTCLPLSVAGKADSCVHPQTFEPVWKPDPMGSHGHWAELDADGAFRFIAFQLAGGTYETGDTGTLTWYGAPADYTVLAATPDAAQFSVTMPLHDTTVQNTYHFTLQAGSPWPTKTDLETFHIVSSKGGWRDGTSGDGTLPAADGPDWVAMIADLLPAEGTYPAGTGCPSDHPSWQTVLDLWASEQADAWTAAANGRPLSARVRLPDTRGDPSLGATYTFALTLAEGTRSWSFTATRSEDVLGVAWSTDASEGTLEEAYPLPPTVVGLCDLWSRIDARSDGLDGLDLQYFPSPFPDVALVGGTSWGWGSHRLVMTGSGPGGVEYSAVLGTLRTG